MLPLRHYFRFFSTDTLLSLLTSRGLTRSSAENVSNALARAAHDEEECLKLAKHLPDAALRDLEAAWVRTVNERPVDCKVRVKAKGREFVVDARSGETLQSLVERGTDLAEYLECACGGNMTCSTCHVYCKSRPKDKIEPEEMDMIDLAWEPKEDSRLGCQLRLKPKEELVVEVPDQSYNHFR